MGNANSGPSPASPASAGESCGPQVGKSGKKICCSCPETKKARDECVVVKGEASCGDLIEAHKKCLREEGFKV